MAASGMPLVKQPEPMRGFFELAWAVRLDEARGSRGRSLLFRFRGLVVRPRLGKGGAERPSLSGPQVAHDRCVCPRAYFHTPAGLGRGRTPAAAA